MPAMTHVSSRNMNHICQPICNPPYYLDFERDSNCYSDNLGRMFENSRDIKKSQQEIDSRFLKKMIDCPDNFRNEEQMVLKVDTKDPVLDSHSFWGINNSSVGEMSESYLLMKQAQEQSQLNNNAHYYQGLSEELKLKQALERQRHLEASGNNLVGDKMYEGINALLSKDYVAANPHSNGSIGCLNAQGEWLESNPRNYLMKNKYAHLKQMDPDQLNRMRGKPVADSCQPVVKPEEGDIFTQTSWHLNHVVPERLSTLSRLNRESQAKILKSQSKLESAMNGGSGLYYSELRNH